MAYFKELCKTDRRFNNFIQQRYEHPLMKKKGIPEIILFMTQRVTKYRLIVEALIKFSKDQQEETLILNKALDNIKASTAKIVWQKG